MGFDLEGAGSFAAGLAGSISQEYGLREKRKRDQEDQEREGMVKLLTAAANSPSLNPEDFPLLITKMLEVQGAKGKDLERVRQGITHLFAPGTTNRGDQVSIGQPEQMPNPDKYGALLPGGEHGIPPVPGADVAVPGAPAMKPVMTPAVRFLSQEDQDQKDIRREVAKRRALLPVRGEEVKQDTEKAVEVRRAAAQAQLTAINQRYENQLSLLKDKEKQYATRKRRQYVDSLMAANSDLTEEEADAQAGKMIIRDFNAGTLQKEAKARLAVAQGKVIPDKINIERAKLKLAQDKFAYEKTIPKSQIQLFNANTKELWAEYNRNLQQLDWYDRNREYLDDGVADQKITEIGTRQDQLLEQIGTEREKLSGGSPTRSRKGARATGGTSSGTAQTLSEAEVRKNYPDKADAILSRARQRGVQIIP